MAKRARVWTGTQWDDVAVQLPDLSNYSTTSQMNTAIDAAKGLVLISSQTFTAQSSISYNNVFTSTYENYKIFFNAVTNSSDGDLAFRLRASGTDYTTANQHYTYIERAGSGFNTGAAASGTGIDIGKGRPSKSDIEITVFSPQRASTQTTLLSNCMYFSSGVNHGNFQGGGAFNTTSSYDGFTIYVGGGQTITGRIRVYGIQN